MRVLHYRGVNAASKQAESMRWRIVHGHDGRIGFVLSSSAKLALHGDPIEDGLAECRDLQSRSDDPSTRTREFFDDGTY